MSFKREGRKIVGNIEFKCPVCEKLNQSEKIEVPKPGNSVDDVVSRTVVIPPCPFITDNKPYVKLVTNCKLCNIEVEQYYSLEL